MFWGNTVKPNQSVTLNPDDGEVLHLSQACLYEPKSTERSYLQITKDSKTFVVCCLSSSSCPHTSIDLFLTTDSDVKLTCVGKNEIHLTGYFEPDSRGKTDEHTALAAETLKNPEEAGGAEESNETDESDEIDMEEEEEEEKVDKATKQGDKRQGKESLGDQVSKGSKDVKKRKHAMETSDVRKAAKTTVSIPPTPKSTTPKSTTPPTPTDSKSGKSDAAFESSLKAYLEANGRTNLALLGNKVKKPADVSMKLGQFLKTRSNVFEISNNMVSLV